MKLFALSFVLACALPAQQPFQVKVAGHGQPMILLPGISSSGEVWDTTVARYKDRFECHVFTLAGFAGVPRIPAPILDTVRDALAVYIRDHKLVKPVIVGHSLGGFLAVSFAEKYPALPGKLVIVDAYPSYPDLYGSAPEQTAAMIDGMRQYYSSMTQEAYETGVKAGAMTREMVAKESDFKRIVAWGLATDRTAMTDAMVELFTGDLRPGLSAIHSPTLVLGSWIGFKQYTDHDRTNAKLHQQYSKLAGAEIHLTDTARHFIMWDDPDWMFALMDRFLAVGPASSTSK